MRCGARGAPSRGGTKPHRGNRQRDSGSRALQRRYGTDHPDRQVEWGGMTTRVLQSERAVLIAHAIGILPGAVGWYLAAYFAGTTQSRVGGAGSQGRGAPQEL